MRLPRLWLPFLFGFADKFTFAAFALLTAPVLVDRFGMGAGAAGFASLSLLGFWIAFLLASPFSGRITDRIGALPMMTGASVIYGLLLVLIGIGTHPLIFLAAMTACGFMTAAQVVPNMAMVGEMAAPEERATNVEAFHVIGSLGYIAGFLLLGALAATSYTAAYAAAGGMEFLVALTGGAVLLLRRPRQSVPMGRAGGGPEQKPPTTRIVQQAPKGNPTA